MSQATTCWYKGKKKEKKGSREGVKGCFGKRAQDPGSRPCTKHFVGQSDPMTLFLWTWIWTSEWSSSKIQSLKHSPGFLTSPTASETSIAPGNNGKQIRNKIRTQKPMVLYINKKGLLLFKWQFTTEDLVWKQTLGLFAILMPNLTLYFSWLMKLRRAHVTMDFSDILLFTNSRWKVTCTYSCQYW